MFIYCLVIFHLKILSQGELISRRPLISNKGSKASTFFYCCCCFCISFFFVLHAKTVNSKIFRASRWVETRNPYVCVSVWVFRLAHSQTRLLNFRLLALSLALPPSQGIYQILAPEGAGEESNASPPLPAPPSYKIFCPRELKQVRGPQ